MFHLPKPRLLLLSFRILKDRKIAEFGENSSCTIGLRFNVIGVFEIVLEKYCRSFSVLVELRSHSLSPKSKLDSLPLSELMPLTFYFKMLNIMHQVTDQTNSASESC